MLNRVVITGIGIYSCIGKNLAETTQSLYQGKSGIILDPARKKYGYRSGLTGFIESPILKGILDRRSRNILSEPAEFAYISTAEALNIAGIDQEFIDKNNIGILFGNDSSAKAVISANDIIREKGETVMVGSGSVFQSMNSTVTMNLSTIFRVKGINFTVSAACASGSHSIGLGYIFIKHGYQDCIICGGAQEINIFSMGNFDALGAFSIREDEPQKASRPFDRDRDGLVPSGGAATVILESLEHALHRGATILGEVIGYGFSSNGSHISNPTIEGPQKALNMSIEQSGITINEIDYINAHATSTPLGDSSEAKALYNVFSQTRPFVSSTKSMTGHECWMAGASEIVYSMLMMEHGFIAPNINFDNPDEDSAKLNILAKTKETRINCFLSNSFGFGGTNASLIIKKWKK
ncbi:MAG: beta-ketoacyl-[acyl-carrier-protein] synthase family protein [Bacteroidota bacterium]